MSTAGHANPSADPVRWGVLSTANIGVKAVIPAIQASSNGRLVALASRDADRAAELLARVAPDARAHDGYEALLADPAVEAVYIPLPNAQHAEWCIRAARAGKHVLCEKPLALTAAEAREIVEACRAAGVLLYEAFMYRLHPQTRWIQRQLAEGRIGAVRHVRAHFGFDIGGREGDIRLQAALGGGSLMDVGCYPVNFCRMVFGGPPRGAAALAVVPAGSQVERGVAAVLDFGEGRTGVVECSFQWPEHEGAEIVGERGRMLVDAPFKPGLDPTVVRVVTGETTVAERVPGGDEYRFQVEEFARCVRAGAPLPIPPEDAVENAAAIERIYGAAGYDWPR